MSTKHASAVVKKKKAEDGLKTILFHINGDFIKFYIAKKSTGRIFISFKQIFGLRLRSQAIKDL